MLLFKRMWLLGLWICKVVELVKWRLTGYPNRNTDDFVAEGDLNCGNLLLEVSEKRNCSMLPRDHSYNVLVKNVAAFYLCLKNLPAAKLKRLRLTATAK